MEMEKLKKIIAEVLSIEPEDINSDMSFIDDLGADSLDIFQIVMGIEEEFDIAIDEEIASKIATVGQAYSAIRSSNEEWE